MIRRRLFLAAVCVAFVAGVPGEGVGFAQLSDDDPGAFVARLGKRTISFLSDKTSSRETRERQLRELFREGFAVDRIGRFVLGKYRRIARPEQVTEFVGVYEDYIVTFYASQFNRYSGEAFDVQKVVKSSKRKDSMVVTKILPADGREPLRVAFQVRKLAEGFKILDVRIEGVSMVLAQRDEFTSYIRDNDGKVDNLTAALKRRPDGQCNRRPPIPRLATTL